jgi:glycosyltransferase involved in cell wall biosynthesis
MRQPTDSSGTPAEASGPGGEARRRLLAICPQLTSGGAERQLVCFCRHVDRRRYDVRVLYYETAGPLLDELRQLGVPSIHLDRSRLGSVGLLRALRREVKQFRPHIIDCRLPSGYRFGRMAALGSGAVVVAEQRTVLPSHGLGGLVDRWLNRWTDAWVGNSAAVVAHLVRDMGVEPSRAHVIYNGLDVERFSGAAADPDLASDRKSGRRVVLNLGNLTRAKNQALFLRVGDRLRQEGADIVLALCGDGVERPALEAIARDQGLTDRCRFLGQRPDVAPVLAAAAVVVQTSDQEGLPNAVMEAMAAGRPVVATRAGGTAELIDDGVDGLLVDVGDEDALVRRTATVLGDENLARRLGEAAAAKIRSRFSATAMAARYHELFDRLLAEKGLAPAGAETESRGKAG